MPIEGPPEHDVRARMVAHQPHLMGQLLRQEHIVGIQENHIVAARFSDAEIARCRLAEIGLAVVVQ